MNARPRLHAGIDVAIARKRQRRRQAIKKLDVNARAYGHLVERAGLPLKPKNACRKKQARPMLIGCRQGISASARILIDAAPCGTALIRRANAEPMRSSPRFRQIFQQALIIKFAVQARGASRRFQGFEGARERIVKRKGRVGATRLNFGKARLVAEKFGSAQIFSRRVQTGGKARVESSSDRQQGGAFFVGESGGILKHAGEQFLPNRLAGVQHRRRFRRERFFGVGARFGSDARLPHRLRRQKRSDH